MTTSEAVEQAMNSHEFRWFIQKTIPVRRMVGRKLVSAPMDAVLLAADIKAKGIDNALDVWAGALNAPRKP